MGPDGCGKDTLARAIRDASHLRYAEPSSLTWARQVAEWSDDRDIRDWWSRRRDHREEWITAAQRLLINGDPDVLYRICMEWSDIYTGIRTFDELAFILESHRYLDGVIWCWNPARPMDLGIDYTVAMSAHCAQVNQIPWRLATVSARDTLLLINDLNLR